METFFHDGHVIRYKVAGQGTPFLFLHNGGGTHHVWDHQFEFFKSRYQVISFDLLGFGESGPNENCHADVHVDYLKAFIEAKNLCHINLAGACMGASIALKLANLMPEKIDHLFLFNICPGRRFIRFAPLQKFFLKCAANPYFVKFCFKVMGWLAPLYIKYAPLPEVLFGKGADQSTAYFQFFKKQYQKREHLFARMRMYQYIHSFTVEDFLKENRIENTYIFWGVNNRIVPLAEGEYLRQIIRPKEYYKVEHAGHLAFGERPELVNQMMSDQLTI